MERLHCFIFLGVFFSCQILAGDIIKSNPQNILVGDKEIYSHNGIFHHPGGGQAADRLLTNIRHRYWPSEKKERVVFDFQESKMGRIYSYYNADSKTLYLEFPRVSLAEGFKSFGEGHYVNKVEVFAIDSDRVNFEIHFKHDIVHKMFILEEQNIPARLVVDLRPK